MKTSMLPQSGGSRPELDMIPVFKPLLRGTPSPVRIRVSLKARPNDRGISALTRYRNA